MPRFLSPQALTRSRPHACTAPHSPFPRLKASSLAALYARDGPVDIGERVSSALFLTELVWEVVSRAGEGRRERVFWQVGGVKTGEVREGLWGKLVVEGVWEALMAVWEPEEGEKKQACVRRLASKRSSFVYAAHTISYWLFRCWENNMGWYYFVSLHCWRLAVLWF